MQESLDQQRARYAWEKVQRQTKEYATLAKGAPALIMGSGLMPVLAFYHGKGKGNDKDHHRALLNHICEWLHKRFGDRIKGDAFDKDPFKAVMSALTGDAGGDAAEHARFYQHATEEAMAILRWIRQFAAAVVGGEGRHDA